MATKKPAKRPNTWLNKSKVCELLGISVQAFNKWGVEPVGREGREVFYTVRDLIDNRIENEKRKDNPGGGDSDEERKQLSRMKYEEEAKLARERRIGQQQKNEISAGQVIPVEFATFALSRIAAQIASILDTLPLTMRRGHPDLEPRHIDSFALEIAKARNKAAEVDDMLPELIEEYVETVVEAS